MRASTLVGVLCLAVWTGQPSSIDDLIDHSNAARPTADARHEIADPPAIRIPVAGDNSCNPQLKVCES